MSANYFHTLKFKQILEPIAPYLNDDGDWVVPEQEESEMQLECRYEPNDAGRSSVSEDGVEFQYGGMIYLSKDTPYILNGTSLDVFYDSVAIASGTVKRFHKGKMNAKIWV